MAARTGGDTGDHGDGELEALGAVDRHERDGVVVGLGQQRLVDPAALVALEVGPVEEAPQPGAPGLLEGVDLVDQEAQAPPDLTGPAVGEGEGEGLTFVAGADRAARWAPATSGPPTASAGGPGRRRRGGPRPGRPGGSAAEVPAAAGLVEGEQVDVGAAVER